MTLESATYITTLSPAAPASGDPRSQGDDHLRLIKQVLQNTFPNADGAFYLPTGVGTQSANYTVQAPSDGGGMFGFNCTSSALTVTLPNSGLFDGFEVLLYKTDYTKNILTVDGNGKTINGQSTIKVWKGYQVALLRYNEVLAAWVAVVSHATRTGAFLDSLDDTVDGYVLCDGQSTIGNASSGATVASAITNALFTLLWTQTSDSVCPVSGGRGASAAADYAANKKITMPDLRGRARFGKDNMGGSAASRITSAVSSIAGDTLGASGGAQTVTLTQANLPNVTLTLSGSGTTSSDGAHTHVVTAANTRTGSSSQATGGNFYASSGDSGANQGIPSMTSSSNGTHSHSVSVTGTTSSINGNTAQTAVNKMPPAFITNVFMAL